MDSVQKIHVQADLEHTISCLLSLNVQYRFETGFGKFLVLMVGL